MQLFNTKVIPADADALWVVPDLPAHMTTARLLVLTRPFAAGGNEEQTLQRMMAACKLTAADYAVLQLENDRQYAWQSIAAAGAPACVLMTGIAPAQLSIHALFRLNAPNTFLGRTFIPTGSLAEIEANPAVKKALWAEALKPVFGL
jgi:hypothetical protein